MYDNVQIQTPTGELLEAAIGLPTGGEKAPVLILAPGSGYTKDGPILVELSTLATEQGFITLRYDWRYTTTGGKPSSNRRREEEDLKSVLAFLDSVHQADANKIFLIGKSLGAGIAYREFHSRPDLFAAVLLTPVFRNMNNGTKNYPGLPEETRPVYILTGRSDPLNNYTLMQDYLHGAGNNVVVSVVDGDHSLNISRAPGSDTETINLENIRFAMQQVMSWAISLGGE
jgi:predicted esterase